MTATTKPRSKRTAVPAVDTDAASTSSVVDALAAAPATGLVEPLPVALLHPHPHNPRRDVGDLTELADSIRAHGIRQNLLVVPDPDHPGEFRIVIGHRRAAAAALAGVTAIPAVVDSSLGDAEQLELMLLENLQRTDLTAVEEADGYQGLLDLGVGARAIAKRTGRSERTITSRLRLLTLPEAAREKVHTHQATLDDALALAAFDGDEDLREDLVDTFGASGFTHRLEAARHEMTSRASVAEERAKLEAAGVTIVESGEYGQSPAGVTPLHVLKGKKQYSSIGEAEHATCPGHVAWVYARYSSASVSYGCKGAAKHGHESIYGDRGTADSGPMTDEQKAERKQLIANNKAALAAETVRRAWIRDLLKRPQMPGDAAVYVARIVRPGRSADYQEKTLLTALLYGKEISDHDVDADLSTPAGAMRHLVALAAARVENTMPKDYWRRDDISHRVHLEQLAAWGYELADVEREYCTKATKR